MTNILAALYGSCTVGLIVILGFEGLGRCTIQLKAL